MGTVEISGHCIAATISVLKGKDISIILTDNKWNDRIFLSYKPPNATSRKIEKVLSL